MATIHVDSWGVKKLFSYGLRRWLVGSPNPRESLMKRNFFLNGLSYLILDA